MELGNGAAFQNIEGHIGGVLAQLGVVDAAGGEGAGLNEGVSAGVVGDTGLVENLGYGDLSVHDPVIGGGEHGVNPANQGSGGGDDLIGGVAGLFQIGNALACMGTILVLGLLLEFDQELIVSLLPKSVTTAIGVSLSELFGGMAGVTTAVIIVTGIGGNMLGPVLCKLFKIEDPVAQGVAFGTAAHVIGTAKANELSQLTGAASSLSLVVAGLLTAVLMPILTQIM